MSDLKSLKEYLDFEGLSFYDEKIKNYVKAQADGSNSSIEEAKKELQESLEALDSALAATNESVKKNAQDIATNASAIEENKSAIEENKAAIDILNGDGEGSVAKAVADAVDKILGGEDLNEALDTIKEIQNWISDDQSGATTLVSKVNANEEAIAKLDEKVDAFQKDSEKKDLELIEYIDKKDTEVYDSIGRINTPVIETLFRNKIVVENVNDVATAIANLQPDEMLVLSEDMAITEDIQIPSGAIIDANGATFIGTVTIPAAEDVFIQNAKFFNPVKVEG